MPLAHWEWQVLIMAEEMATHEERVELFNHAATYGSNLIDMQYWKDLVDARAARAEAAAGYAEPVILVPTSELPSPGDV